VRAPRIYAIADAATLGEPLETNLPQAVTAMAEAGVRWIQLRAKPKPPAEPYPDRRLYDLLAVTLEALDGSGCELWIDDRVDLTAMFANAALPVAGVHLGQNDLPPAAARRVIGDEVRIGLSTHTEAQVAAAADDPDVDVVAVGPVFATDSKSNPDPVVGLELVRTARRILKETARERDGRAKILVAIGGIGPQRVAGVLEAGADSVAVLSAACRGPVAENCRKLVAAAEAWDSGETTDPETPEAAVSDADAGADADPGDGESA